MSGLGPNQPSGSEPHRPRVDSHVSSLHPGAKAVSERQFAANRSNARLSTGPRSAEGRAKVAQNAYRSGAYSLRTGYVRSGPSGKTRKRSTVSKTPWLACSRPATT